MYLKGVTTFSCHFSVNICFLSIFAGLLLRTPYKITVTPLFNDITGHSIHTNPFCSSTGGKHQINFSLTQKHINMWSVPLWSLHTLITRINVKLGLHWDIQNVIITQNETPITKKSNLLWTLLIHPSTSIYTPPPHWNVSLQVAETSLFLCGYWQFWKFYSCSSRAHLCHGWGSWR